MSSNNEEAMADLYEGLPVPINSGFSGYFSSSNEQNSCVYTGDPAQNPDDSLRNGQIQDLAKKPGEKDMQYSCGPDSTEQTVAFFQNVDDVTRERVDMEIDALRENIHKILCDQQMQFREAFALRDSLTSSRESMHVVPQSAYLDDTSSEEHRMIGESSSDSDYISVEWEDSTCSKMRKYSWERDEINPRNAVQKLDDTLEWNSCLYKNDCSEVSSPAKYGDEGRILSYLVRLLTASTVISNTLRRKEYAT